MTDFFYQFPAGISFVCGFLVCLLLILLFLKQLESK